MHSQYYKILKQHLGMSGVSAVNPTTFYKTIKLPLPVVTTMLNEMCNEAKADMKVKATGKVGS